MFFLVFFSVFSFVFVCLKQITHSRDIWFLLMFSLLMLFGFDVFHVQS